MTQAITTRYIAPTTHRGARIKAECERGELVVAWDYAISTDENHVKARDKLTAKFATEDLKLYGTSPMRNVWLRKWFTGTLKDGTFVHVQRVI